MDKSELRVPKVCAQNREVIIIEGGGGLFYLAILSLTSPTVCSNCSAATLFNFSFYSNKRKEFT